jgi:hypothetical protein
MSRVAVNSPRLSITTLMVVVAIIALDIAALRALFAHNPMLPIGLCLIGIALHVGLFQLARSRDKARAFWTGFIACGLVSAMSFAWGMLFPRFVDLARTGAPLRTPSSAMGQLWMLYAEHVAIGLDSLPFLSRFLRRMRPGSITNWGLLAVIWSLPQFLVALIGGVLARLLYRPRGRTVAAGEPATLLSERA